jgi:dihydroorotate dehydrogenase
MRATMPFKPWLLLSPKMAHDLAPIGLQALAAFRKAKVYEWQPLEWQGLKFKNRLGTAGGVDKDGSLVQPWWTFGPGFLEIGTVTPQPQGPNEGRIIDRDHSAQAIWNRMGFPGRGAEIVATNLRVLPREHLTPLFINIGKNRSTTNQNAAHDYIECIDRLAFAADAFVVNISSPNTSGLRDLFRTEIFRPFLGAILEARNHQRKNLHNRQLPLLLKLSPDLSDEDLNRIVDVSAELGIDGWIATNTTMSREDGSPFPAEGGVSGRPLAERSKKVLSILLTKAQPFRKGKLIVSAGGVMTPEDVNERLVLGADLVQIYAALIYEGPQFFCKVARHMTQQASRTPSMPH